MCVVEFAIFAAAIASSEVPQPTDGKVHAVLVVLNDLCNGAALRRCGSQCLNNKVTRLSRFCNFSNVGPLATTNCGRLRDNLVRESTTLRLRPQRAITSAC